MLVAQGRVQKRRKIHGTIVAEIIKGESKKRRWGMVIIIKINTTWSMYIHVFKGSKYFNSFQMA